MTANIVASIKSRLSNKASTTNRPYQELLQFYGLERFLYRLSQSQHRDAFILKGALALQVWKPSTARPTRDIDLLGFGINSIENFHSVIHGICETEVDDDGLRFESDAIVATQIKRDADYQGVRLKFNGYLSRSRIPMQIDIGFGDVVTPVALTADYPTILDMPAPRLRIYPRETIVAEKTQAMVFLGTLNSRVKDFYDIWLLASLFEFSGIILSSALKKTFVNRSTPIEIDPAGLSAEYTKATKPAKQWLAYLKKNELSGPESLENLAEQLRLFIVPVLSSLAQGEKFNYQWKPGGPWLPNE